MDTSAETLPAREALLRHRGFLRALARSLIGDDRAEDLAQDACVAALERPPKTLTRAWLARVTRNLAAGFWRREGARGQRERAAALSEPSPPTAEAVARLDLQRRIVEEVHALAEPYRTVIVERFLFDRSPGEIARRLGIPRETVRTRLRRALALLRGRLDRAHGGRKAWLGAVAALAASGKAVSAGVLAAVAVGAVLAVGSFVALQGRGGAGDAPERAAVAAPEVVAQAGQPAPAQAPQQEPRWTFTVHDAQGNRVDGALIRLVRWTAPEDAVVTDVPRGFRDAGVTGADGTCALAPPGKGRWLVAIVAPGCPPRFSTSESGEESANWIQSIGVGREYRVRLVDENGRAVPGARALVGGRPPHTETTSNASGDVIFRACASDWLYVRAQGYAWLTVDLGDAPREVVLAPEYRLGGVVVDREGEPVAKARVRIERPPGVHELTVDGRFLYEGLGPKRVDLLVDAPGFAPTHRKTLPGDERLRVVLDRPVEVRGVVRLESGKPAAGAEVEFSVRGFRELPEIPEQRTDATGRFGAALTPGPWRVSVEHGDLRRSVEFEAEGPATEVPVDLGGGSFVRVRVVDADGKPVPGASLWGSLTDDDGRAVVTLQRPPGSTLRIYARHGQDRGVLDVETAAGRDGPEHTLVLRSPVRVTVVARGADGEALPPDTKAKIVLHGSATRRLERGRDRCTFSCDPGRQYLSVSAPGHGSFVSRSWRPPAGGGEVEIRLPRGAEVRGRVPGVKGAVVHVGRRSVRTDETGVFSTRVPEGRVVVSIGREGEVPGFVHEAEAPLDLGDVVLRGPWTLRGQVLEPGGRPAGGALVGVLAGRNEIPGLERSRVVTRADGSFALRVPPWGHARLVVRKDGWAAEPLRLDEIDAAAPIAARLQPEARLKIDVKTPGLTIQSLWLRRPGKDWEWPPSFSSRWQWVEAGALPPGRWIVRIVGRDFGPKFEGADRGDWMLEREFDLVAGRKLEADVHPRR